MNLIYTKFVSLNMFVNIVNGDISLLVLLLFQPILTSPMLCHGLITLFTLFMITHIPFHTLLIQHKDLSTHCFYVP